MEEHPTFLRMGGAFEIRLRVTRMVTWAWSHGRGHMGVHRPLLH